LPCASGKRTANKLFAVRFYYSARQSIFSPNAFPSKPNVILLKILCRVYYFRRTANTCVFIIAHGKVFFTYYP
jgi:hypothetical protein